MAARRAPLAALYRRLIGLYPRAFREQLGESMAQTFADLCREQSRRPWPARYGFVLRVFVDTALGAIREHGAALRQGDTMRQLLGSPRSLALLSLALCLPFIALATMIALQIEPNFGPLQPLLISPDPDQPDVGISLLALGAVVLVAVAFLLNLRLILRTLRAGATLLAHPANLLIALAALAALATVAGLIIVDQYPCWAGVPNCD